MLLACDIKIIIACLHASQSIYLLGTVTPSCGCITFKRLRSEASDQDDISESVNPFAAAASPNRARSRTAGTVPGSCNDLDASTVLGLGDCGERSVERFVIHVLGDVLRAGVNEHI